MSSKLALLGPKDMVTPLAGSGVEVFACDSTRQSQETLQRLTGGKAHAIVFLNERYAGELQAEIADAEDKGLNVLLLPDHRGSTGLYREMLQALIRKATGANA